MNVSFAINIAEESKGKFSVTATKNGIVVYSSQRLSGTQEKAEKRAHKVLADLLREEAREVATRHPFAFLAEKPMAFEEV